jgi:uncharacterized protein YggE
MSKAAQLVVVAAVAGAVLALPAGAAEPGEIPGITVTGTHAVRVAPDMAEWSFGVQARASTARAALRAAAARSRAVVAALRAAGVAREDIQTQNVSLYPHVDDGTGKVEGFQASSGVRVVVRSLGRVGAVVDAAARAGATDIFGPQLTTSNRENLHRQALERAYDAARANGEALARATGLSLGRPIAVVEGAMPGGGDYRVMAGAEYAAADVELEPGRSEVTATVTVTFAAS